MRDIRLIRLVTTLVLVSSSCTQQTEPARDDVAPAPQPSQSSEAPAPSVSMASGSALPDGCAERSPRPAQTVAFVAGGRAWALDPDGDRPTCLFEVDDAGPFAWGPQGDRVLLEDLEVRGVTRDAPSLPPVGVRALASDWGHPIGLALVFSQRGDRTPSKRFIPDGRVDPLGSLPGGRYVDIAYHPSGLALAFVIDRHGDQSIWLSTNEGTDPARLVFSEGGTRFTSIAFTPDGQHLVWSAQHAGDYPQIHSMDLADRTGFTDGWRGDQGQEASNLHLAPTGRLMAVDEGSGCADRTATIVLSPTVARPALPGASEPTTILGWLDRSTVLVGAGGCSEGLDVSAVAVSGKVTPLVLGVDAAAARTITTSWPDSVPAPPAQADEEPPPEGVG
jgi:WD40-like Beta Propeller Repeat